MAQKTDVITKYSYLIGQTINKWTILEILKIGKQAYAKCKCECGTIKNVRVLNILYGSSKDCGCGRKKMLRETKSGNLIGKKFGRLTVIEMLEESNKFNRRQYKCLCDCGNEIIVPSSSLTSNHTLSCGCLVSYYNSYIAQLLDERKIEYKSEYRILIDNKQYRFDFYLPKYNLFIEYDGSQHFSPRFYIGMYKSEEIGMEKFKSSKQRDIEKNEYCKRNNINLLRIPYWKSNNVEAIIDNYLQRLNDKGFATAV